MTLCFGQTVKRLRKSGQLDRHIFYKKSKKKFEQAYLSVYLRPIYINIKNIFTKIKLFFVSTLNRKLCAQLKFYLTNLDMT